MNKQGYLGIDIGTQGLSVIFISHKLDEVLRVSQRIAILRGGKLIAVLPAEGADKSLLAETMVGRNGFCSHALPLDRVRTLMGLRDV